MQDESSRMHFDAKSSVILPGTHVQVIGLTEHPEYNYRIGAVSEMLHASGYYVVLLRGSNSQEEKLNFSRDHLRVVAKGGGDAGIRYGMLNNVINNDGADH